MHKSIVLYDTALCNLKCRYCFISKNNAMLELDKEIENSFSDPNYYIDLAKHYYGTDLQEVERIEVWGGEPLLFLSRTFGVIERMIEESPAFHEILFSSNYSHDNVVPSIQELVKILSKYPDRKFKILTQISCDGPTELNDGGRGEGVTQRILDNFHTLIENQYFVTDTPNIEVKMVVKPTLDMTNFSNLLERDYNIYYYKFFEDNFIEPVMQLHNPRIYITPPKPNLAVPAEYTQEHGLILRDIVKLQRDIEQENLESRIFKYYNNITLFDKSRDIKFDTADNYFYNGGFCGTGRGMIGLLPEGKACGCHRCFADYSEEYSKQFKAGIPTDSSIITSDSFASSNYMVFNNKGEYEDHVRRIATYYFDKDVDINYSSTLMSSQTTELKTLAFCGLVEEKYKDTQIAAATVKNILSNMPGCLTDNLITCKVPMCASNHQFKLFCNGAIDYILRKEH